MRTIEVPAFHYGRRVVRSADRLPLHLRIDRAQEAAEAARRDHDCMDYLRERSVDCVETHGLECGPYERYTETWWECSICKELFDEKDIQIMASEKEPRQQ